ncbi:MAG: ABC transporter permease [Acidobacteria bacterium]|nr:ABC transporter permease [Acidobacteriota bacterium]
MTTDIRFAFRIIRKTPGFAMAFILTLGLGIGANTAIFSIINGVLLRPLPYPDADRIMHVRQAALRAGVENTSFSFPEVADYRRESKTVEEFVEFGDWTFNVLGRGDPHRATGGLVTPNFFKVLGMQPLLGRTLIPEDLEKSAPPVAVLTYEYWTRMFGADTNVVAQTLDLTVKKAVIVGVLRPGSHYATQRKQDFYVNYAANDHYMSASMQDERIHRMTQVFAKLTPGATPENAQAELRQIASSLHTSFPQAYPAERGYDVIVTPWKEELTARARPTLIILLGTTVFVLVIACANVANLTLTRLVQREREMAIRAALGAQRSSLRRQLLAENLILSVLGGALGIGIAVAGLDLLVDYTARFTNRTGEIHVDLYVLGFTLLVSIGAAVLFAWAPRLSFATDPARSMTAAGSSRTTGSVGRRRAQRALVVSQLAASFMLLVGAGLLIRSLLQLYAVDPGFDLNNVLSLEAPNFAQTQRERELQFTREVMERMKVDPSVQNMASASAAPLAGSFPVRSEIRVEGQDPDANASAPMLVTRVVSGSYFDTVGTQLRSGRTFRETDKQGAPLVAIMSESMTRYYFPDIDPIGRRFSFKQFNGQWSQWYEVIGVAADTKADGLNQETRHTVYYPDTQRNAQSTFLVRTAGNTERLGPQVIETIRQLDPNRPVDHVRTLEEIRSESIAPQRLNATLIGLFAVLALAIATVGVAGVLSFSVSQRTNELGIRMALGAERTSILRMILGEGSAMAAIGLVIGGIASVPLTRFLSGLLFEVAPIDPPTMFGAAVLLLIVALAAAFIPARRATRVDPMVALRSE